MTINRWLLPTILVLGACKSPAHLKNTESGLASASDGKTPNSAGSRLDVDDVVNAMNEIKKHDGAVATQSVVEGCTANNTPHWSPIVSHFYCQIGMGRSCFTGYVRDSSKPGYQTTKSYMDGFEACRNDANFSWIYNHPTVSQVFKYIMFSVYSSSGINTFSLDSQDEAINKFYKVTSAGNCQLRFKSSTDDRRPAAERCGIFASVTSPPAKPQPAVTPPQVSPQPIAPKPTTPAFNCSTLSNVSTCSNQSACFWAYNKRSSQIGCFNKTGQTCGYYSDFDAGLCAGQAGCFWAYNKKSSQIGCFEKSGQSCTYYSDFDAGACGGQTGCFWAYNKRSTQIGCFEKTGQSCTYYSDFDAGACANQAGCMWKYNKRTTQIGCFIKDGQSCSYYTDFDAAACQSQAKCKWWYNPGQSVIECANK